MPGARGEVRDFVSAQMQANTDFIAQAIPGGVFSFQCRRADGELLWRAEAPNMIVDVGVQYLLNGISAAPTIVGPFLGLMGGTGTVAGGDTMASHAGWIEVGGTNAPAYTGNRATPTWSAASGRSKAISASVSFTFTSGGNVLGAFLVLSTGAVNTKDSTAGVLYSVGAFQGGTQPVVNTNVLTVSYSTNLT